MSFSGVGFFCESIRTEVGGTNTLVGLIPDNMVVRRVPGVIHGIGLYIRVNIDVDLKVGPMAVSLYFSDGTEHPVQTVDENFIRENQRQAKELGAPFVGILARVNMQQFPIPALGRARAVIHLNGEERVVATLNFVLSPDQGDSVTSPLSSGESQPQEKRSLGGRKAKAKKPGASRPSRRRASPKRPH
jgi:hypothetical protein